MDRAVYDPVLRYSQEMREAHSRNTKECFDELLAKADIDKALNAKTVAEIERLGAEIAANTRSIAKLNSLRIFALALVVAGYLATVLLMAAALGSASRRFPSFDIMAGLACGVAASWLLRLTIRKLIPKLDSAREQKAKHEKLRDANLEKAWRQMEPLNSLFDWDTATRLCARTLPILEFDDFFARKKLRELVEEFGWDNSFNSNKSVVFIRSGSIRGNPFLIAETLDLEIISKVYEGTRLISWTERMRDPDGKIRSVRRYQTLYATITKPAPSHSRNRFLIYGNEAAPNLRFSRAPSALSTLDGAKYKRGLRRRIKELEKFSRNLDDEHGFTLLTNKEFDALFGATDRDNEVQFRVLFTPLTQANMLKLIRDDKVGYGDTFDFVKDGMINLVTPRHLSEIDLSADPANFRHYSLAGCREVFNRFNTEYFKHIYFAFAPLLSIPIYQNHRSHHDIYKDVYERACSFWEHEALANLHGEDAFAHPDSATPSLLKTKLVDMERKTETVEVTAHGFSGHERVEHVTVRGNDNRWHQVPVRWIEYLPVKRSSPLIVHRSEPSEDFMAPYGESEEMSNLLQQYNVPPEKARFRKTLVSFLPARQ